MLSAATAGSPFAFAKMNAPCKTGEVRGVFAAHERRREHAIDHPPYGAAQTTLAEQVEALCVQRTAQEIRQSPQLRRFAAETTGALVVCRGGRPWCGIDASADLSWVVPSQRARPGPRALRRPHQRGPRNGRPRLRCAHRDVGRKSRLGRLSFACVLALRTASEVCGYFKDRGGAATVQPAPEPYRHETGRISGSPTS